MPTRLALGMLLIGLLAAPSCDRPVEEPVPTMDTTASLGLIPQPQQVHVGEGTFDPDEDTQIVLSDPTDPALRALADLHATWLRDATGLLLPISDALPGTDNTIAFVLPERMPEERDESYQLEVSPETVTLSATHPAGLFYAAQTLRQLFPGEGEARSIQAATIEDAPRFVYRGMHLDVGRHFFPVDFIKKYIDLLAMYKMNTFHWHLTEDQGWRIEIKKYPKLTEVGAYRKETIVEKNFNPYVGDGERYGGFYTQDEVREVVAYAQERYVTVIPEIEMPGHSTAAVAAYPELGCTGEQVEVTTRWGVFPDIYCPSEETFAFLEDVLTEVMDLFPSRYIHIGGDEAPKTQWEESPVAQEVIQREGLADEHELQSYFIRRIEQFLLEHDRRLIGWDEILEGGLAPEATVMSWRGMAGGVEAARQGHDVIMTPNSHVYLDHYQGDPDHEPLAIGGFSPLEKVYAFEPVPEDLNAEEARHVLGTQGNVWTEYMKTTDHVEYMVFPRLLALAEVGWSPKDARDWDSFVQRLQPHFQRLDALNVNYRVPAIQGLSVDRLSLEDTTTVTLNTLYRDAAIYYTTDGTEPTTQSPRYTEPIAVPVADSGTVITARVFVDEERSSPIAQARITKTTLRQPADVDAETLQPGLAFAYYDAGVASVENLKDQVVAQEGVAETIGLQDMETRQPFGLRFTGFLHIPTDGVYTFALTSDDGSRLAIGHDVVIDHDGYHSERTKQGARALAAGYHPITVLYFQAGGGQALDLAIARADETPQSISTAWLFHVGDTSP
ncbi:MAG TPA: family 20 glycosylhydrolase [Rhodothermales bacterium]|nr:family 20 glycosylhydrolase [Rhodothermales bacterium]